MKNNRKVAQYDINGNYIKTYNSTNEASKETNVSQSSISMCALGRYKQAKGYIFKYLKSKGE
jgi:hypothetical protein